MSTIGNVWWESHQGVTISDFIWQLQSASADVEINSLLSDCLWLAGRPSNLTWPICVRFQIQNRTDTELHIWSSVFRFVVVSIPIKKSGGTELCFSKSEGAKIPLSPLLATPIIITIELVAVIVVVGGGSSTYSIISISSGGISFSSSSSSKSSSKRKNICTMTLYPVYHFLPEGNCSFQEAMFWQAGGNGGVRRLVRGKRSKIFVKLLLKKKKTLSQGGFSSCFSDMVITELRGWKLYRSGKLWADNVWGTYSAFVFHKALGKLAGSIAGRDRDSWQDYWWFQLHEGPAFHALMGNPIVQIPLDHKFSKFSDHYPHNNSTRDMWTPVCELQGGGVVPLNRFHQLREGSVHHDRLIVINWLRLCLQWGFSMVLLPPSSCKNVDHMGFPEA